jgi:hypothetical protein
MIPGVDEDIRKILPSGIRQGKFFPKNLKSLISSQKPKFAQKT